MRFEAWERRLSAIIDGYGRVPFEWGKNDCFMFVAACVWCLTQKDIAEPWRHKYDSEFGALRFIAEAGGFAELFEKALLGAGLPVERIAPAFGQRGDPCLVTTANGDTLAIIEGAKLAAQAQTGLERWPYNTAKIVWAIR